MRRCFLSDSALPCEKKYLLMHGALKNAAPPEGSQPAGVPPLRGRLPLGFACHTPGFRGVARRHGSVRYASARLCSQTRLSAPLLDAAVRKWLRDAQDVILIKTARSIAAGCFLYARHSPTKYRHSQRVCSQRCRRFSGRGGECAQIGT